VETGRREIRVLAHYYVEPAYNPFSCFNQRVAVEALKVPSMADYVILNPTWMKMNETKLGPGLYKVVDVRPNSKNSVPVFDYSPYGSWFKLEKMRMVLVKPVFTVTTKTFFDYHISIDQTINDDGTVSEIALITNSLTGETKELELE